MLWFDGLGQLVLAIATLGALILGCSGCCQDWSWVGGCCLSDAAFAPCELVCVAPCGKHPVVVNLIAEKNMSAVIGFFVAVFFAIGGP